MTTTPAWPVPSSMTVGRPLPWTAPAAPAAAPGTVWTEEWAAVPACRMTARGRRPVTEKIAAALLQAVTTP